MEIVGVVRDAFYSSVKNDIRPMVIPFGHGPFLQRMTYVLRTTGKPTSRGGRLKGTLEIR